MKSVLVKPLLSVTLGFGIVAGGVPRISQLIGDCFNPLRSA